MACCRPAPAWTRRCPPDPGQQLWQAAADQPLAATPAIATLPGPPTIRRDQRRGPPGPHYLPVREKAPNDLWSRACGRLCQVSRGAGQPGAAGVVVDVAGDGGQCGAEFGGSLGLVRGGQRDQEPVVDLGVEDGDADAVRGEHVAVGVREPADEAVEAQPPQVVGHLPRGVSAAEQPGDQDTEVLVGEAGCGEQRLAKGATQSNDPRIAEA